MRPVTHHFGTMRCKKHLSVILEVLYRWQEISALMQNPNVFLETIQRRLPCRVIYQPHDPERSPRATTHSRPSVPCHQYPMVRSMFALAPSWYSKTGPIEYHHALLEGSGLWERVQCSTVDKAT